MTNFSLGDENVDRRIVSPDKVSPYKVELMFTRSLGGVKILITPRKQENEVPRFLDIHFVFKDILSLEKSSKCKHSRGVARDLKLP